MYACLLNTIYFNNIEKLVQVALEFAPVVETNTDNVVFSITPLRKLLGPPPQIAAEICRLGYERKLQANLALVSNVDTAILLARHIPGVTLVTPGEEHYHLAPLPLACLAAHEPHTDPKLFEILQKWGLRTCGDLAALNPKSLAERLGPLAVHVRNLACGRFSRPLHLASEPANYEKQMELEHPLIVLEPLLFLISSALRELCEKLKAQSSAARSLHVQLRLEGRKEYRCELKFPIPLQDVRTLLKLLQLHLERHSPEAAVEAFFIRIEPATPKRVQNGFFTPALPMPDRLELTLARIRGIVGDENVITPQVMNTHRPDAFLATDLETGLPDLTENSLAAESGTRVLRLAMRLFRPALPARVKLEEESPLRVLANRVRGEVVHRAGPWKTSGEWWAKTSWTRVEWDVALNDGGLYRIYQEATSNQWFVHGIYD